MANENLCPLCNLEVTIKDLQGRSFLIHCQRCGKFTITQEAFEDLPNETTKIKENLYLVSGLTRNIFEFSDTYLQISNDYGDLIDSIPSKSVIEKKNLILKFLIKKSNYPGDQIVLNPDNDYTIAFCKNSDELHFYLTHLAESDLIDDSHTAIDNYRIHLTAEAWEEYEKILEIPADSNQVFLAMNFNKDFDDQYQNGLKPAIEEAGYDCFRMDEKHHNRKICEEILHEIEQSKFLVADVTGLNGGVYFEAGYAMALGKEIIWSCQEDHKDEDVHFDTRQYNHIFWKDIKDLKEKLRDRILGSVGRGKNEVKPD